MCVDRIYFLQQEVSLTDFAAEDLAARVKFFGSALYKDFAQKRSQALLIEAKKCTDAKVQGPSCAPSHIPTVSQQIW